MVWFEEDLKWRIERAAEQMVMARHVVALTGAGVSVESGIRPFRGPEGVWTEHGEPPVDGYERFLADPKADWERVLSREGYAEGFAESFESAVPNPGHHALAELEQMGVLKFIITQNVDNLHRAAGSRKLAEIHGNFRLLRCIKCNARYPQEQIPLNELPPHCPECGGVVKMDGVYFGEPIPADTLEQCREEVSRCDCMLLVGTSGLVYPAAGFPHQVKKRGGWLIEVDAYPTDLSPFCGIILRGKSGHLLPQLARRVRARVEEVRRARQ